MSENAVPNEGPAELDFSKIKITGLSGLRSINADTTPDQLLTGAIVPNTGGQSTIQILDDGIGGHTFGVKTLFATTFTPAGVPFAVPTSVRTTVLTLVVPTAGLWYFTGNVNLQGGLAGTTVMRTVLANGVSDIGESTQESVIEPTLSTISASVTSILLQLVGAEVITLDIHQVDSALGVLSFNAVLDGIRLGL